MDRLPSELIDAVLQHCIHNGPKNAVLELRLVCRVFDRILKPYACRTLELEFSRLSKTSRLSRPQADALQTIGYHCKSLYIDLMVLRDDMEVEFLHTVFARIPWMSEFCHALQTTYCMNETSFTELEYYQAVEDLLFNCRDIERLRLNLPFQLVGRHCNAATIILANTFKALANRPEEDSADMKILVLDNVPDVAVCHLWMNPCDVMNIMKVLAELEHLVITLRRHETEPQRVGMFGSCLWSLIEHAAQLKSLCLVGTEHDDRPPRGLKQTRFWQMPLDEWRARSLPPPRPVWQCNLTCLELKRVEISAEALLQAADGFGASLRELYLNEVYLKTERSSDWNLDSSKVLWVGLPNQRPADDCRWIAVALRCAAPELRTCRAAFLAYDHYLADDAPATKPDFDLVDPCGRGRSLSQRFVEVVMGIRQPDTPTGQTIDFLPRAAEDDRLAAATVVVHPGKTVGVTDYDTNAYQSAVDNTTSRWQKSIDGIFLNCNPNTLDELHYIAETACKGMNEIHRRRNDATQERSMANEYADNLRVTPPPHLDEASPESDTNENNTLET